MIASIPARLSANPLLVDATIALGLSALSLLTVVGGATDAGGRDPLSVTLLLLETLPLVVRRRWPIPVLVVTLGSDRPPRRASSRGRWSTRASGRSSPCSRSPSSTTRRVSVTAALAFAAVVRGAARLDGRSQARRLGRHPDDARRRASSWALGDWARTRRRYAAAIEENARLQEADREERSRRAVQDERERIARELHDIVTHHVSVIVIQAGAGLTALDRRPEQAKDGARGHRPDQSRGPDRHAPDARDAGRAPDRPPVTQPREPMPAPRATRRAHRGGPRRRSAGRAVDRWRAASARCRRRAVRLSDRPGGPDERPQARDRAPAPACVSPTSPGPSTSR